MELRAQSREHRGDTMQTSVGPCGPGDDAQGAASHHRGRWRHLELLHRHIRDDHDAHGPVGERQVWVAQDPASTCTVAALLCQPWWRGVCHLLPSQASSPQEEGEDGGDHEARRGGVEARQRTPVHGQLAERAPEGEGAVDEQQTGGEQAHPADGRPHDEAAGKEERTWGLFVGAVSERTPDPGVASRPRSCNNANIQASLPNAQCPLLA